MTKYADKKYYMKPNDTPIAIGRDEVRENDSVSKIYVCDNCHITLNKLIDISGENISYYCSRCNIEVSPYDTDLRSKSRLKTPDGPIEEPAIATTPEPTLGRKKTELKGAFKALRDRGIKFTSYTEGKG